MWVQRFLPKRFRDEGSSKGLETLPIGMPNEVVVTNPVLVQQWWEFSQQSAADPAVAPVQPFVRWLLNEVVPFSIRLEDSGGGSIAQFHPSLFLSVSFRSEADKAAYEERWS